MHGRLVAKFTLVSEGKQLRQNVVRVLVAQLQHHAAQRQLKTRFVFLIQATAVGAAEGAAGSGCAAQARLDHRLAQLLRQACLGMGAIGRGLLVRDATQPRQNLIRQWRKLVTRHTRDDVVHQRIDLRVIVVAQPQLHQTEHTVHIGLLRELQHLRKISHCCDKIAIYRFFHRLTFLAVEFNFFLQRSHVAVQGARINAVGGGGVTSVIGAVGVVHLTTQLFLQLAALFELRAAIRQHACTLQPLRALHFCLEVLVQSGVKRGQRRVGPNQLLHARCKLHGWIQIFI